MKIFDITTQWWQLVVIAISCYLVGCFNFARLISKFKKRDITKIGSGNPGTMNMSREFGLKIGFITFFCDAFKGGVPPLICFFIYRNTYFSGTETLASDFIRYFCGLFVIIGHVFPVTSKFKGGKGIASTFGLFWFALSCENPWFILIIFVLLWGVVLFIFLTEWGSLGSLFGVTAFSIIQVCIFLFKYGIGTFNAYLVCLYMIILAINVLTWCAHHANVIRLFAGEEHRTSIRKLSKKKKKA